MVVKIRGGVNLYGALKYNKEKLDEGTARVILTNNVAEQTTAGNLMQAWLLSFQPYLDANIQTKRPVIHVSLNPAPTDVLTDAQYMALAAEYMERMGYGDQPYVAFLHEDIDRKHLHIVSLRVGLDGRKISHDYERRRSNEIRIDLERKHGLAPARKGQEDHLPLRRVDYPRGHLKAQIGSAVRNCLDQYRFSSFGELNALLGLFGVEV